MFREKRDLGDFYKNIKGYWILKGPGRIFRDNSMQSLVMLVKIQGIFSKLYRDTPPPFQGLQHDDLEVLMTW